VAGADVATPTGARLQAAGRLRTFASTYATELQLLAGLAILYAIFAALYPSIFPTVNNTVNMARAGGILLVVAIGQMLALVSGGFDLSVGANMGFVATLSCFFMVKLTYPLGWSIVLGLAIGAGVGLLNGFLISAVRINPLITTLGMATFLLGLGFIPNGAQPIFGLPPDFVTYFGAGDWGPIPAPVCISAIVLLVMWLVLARSKAGVYIYAIGGSRDTCRVAGIPVVRYEILAYTLCGLLAGLAGLMLGARISIVNADIGANSGYDLESIATAVIGGALIGGGLGRLSGVVLGVALLTVLETGLDIAHVHEFIQQMVEGVVLVTAVLIAQLRAGQIRDIARVLRLGRPPTVAALESIAARRRAVG